MKLSALLACGIVLVLVGVALSMAVLLPSSGSAGRSPGAASLSEAAYFEELGQAMDGLQLRFAEVPVSVWAITGGDPGADAESRDVTARGLRALSTAAAEFEHSLAAIQPPRQLAGAHRDMVDAGVEIATWFEALADQLAGDQPFEEIEGDLAGLLESGPMTGFLSACVALQDLSEDRFNANCGS